MEAVGGLQLVRYREGSTGRSQSGGNPPFSNNFFNNKYTIGSTNTNADLKQPQIHKHLKNARGQTNPFFKNINTEKQDSKNNNKNTQMTSATLLHKVGTSWEVFFLQGCVSQELFFSHQNFFGIRRCKQITRSPFLKEILYY